MTAVYVPPVCRICVQMVELRRAESLLPRYTPESDRLSCQFRQLQRDHPKCSKCGWLFGPAHDSVESGGGMCQPCSRKYGRKKRHG